MAKMDKSWFITLVGLPRGVFLPNLKKFGIKVRLANQLKNAFTLYFTILFTIDIV